MGGGPGDFMVHSYLLSLVQAPVLAATSIVGLVPCMGALGGFALSLYSLYLTTLAMPSAHNFSGGRAVAVWLIPLVVLFFLALCLVVTVVALAAVFIGGRG